MRFVVKNWIKNSIFGDILNFLIKYVCCSGKVEYEQLSEMVLNWSNCKGISKEVRELNNLLIKIFPFS